MIQTQSLLAGVARVVSEEASLETTLSRTAVLLRDEIAFDRLHVLRLDRSDSVTLYLVRATGEIEVTGHLIGDGGAASPGEGEAAERSRLIVSEPLSDLAGVWNEVPESTCGVIRGDGTDYLQPFVPRRTNPGAVVGEPESDALLMSDADRT